MCGNVRLRFHVYVLCSIEAWRSTGTDAVCPECLDSLFLERLVCDEVIEVVGCEICDCSPVRELGFRPCRSTTISIPFSSWVANLTYPIMTGLFSFSSSSNTVGAATSGSGVQSSINSSISCTPISILLRPFPCPHIGIRNNLPPRSTSRPRSSSYYTSALTNI